VIVVELPQQRPPALTPKAARALARIVAKAHQHRPTDQERAA
jgi:hypothetical protein